MSNTQIMIVTFNRDFPYLEWCLKSISKFARGFSKLNVLIPEEDKKPLRDLVVRVATTHPLPFPILISFYEDWPGKGMLMHMRQIMFADEFCKDADFIAHIDADCIFTEPVTPDDYIKDGKPILRYEPFDRIGKRHGGVMRWKEVTEKCLPFPILHETMRCHPEVYHRGLYREARELMERKIGKSVDDYLKEQRNEFPQTFCEFCTLGNVAMERFRDRYILVECFKDIEKPKENKLYQCWSHGGLERIADEKTGEREIDIIKKYL